MSQPRGRPLLAAAAWAGAAGESTGGDVGRAFPSRTVVRSPPGQARGGPPARGESKVDTHGQRVGSRDEVGLASAERSERGYKVG